MTCDLTAFRPTLQHPALSHCTNCRKSCAEFSQLSGGRVRPGHGAFLSSGKAFPRVPRSHSAASRFAGAPVISSQVINQGWRRMAGHLVSSDPAAFRPGCLGPSKHVKNMLRKNTSKTIESGYKPRAKEPASEYLLP